MSPLLVAAVVYVVVLVAAVGFAVALCVAAARGDRAVVMLPPAPPQPRLAVVDWRPVWEWPDRT